MSKLLLEICCGGPDDVRTAALAGADRAELNSALWLGGLTPSLGSLMAARKAAPGLPIICMVRPRAGGFCYSEVEFTAMLTDARALLHAGAAGIAFGCLLPDGQIDQARCKRMLRVIGKHERVFHRAFDTTPDPLAALDQLIALGFTRVLTSGAAATAPLGSALLAQLTQRAEGRIEILAGSGINAENAAELVHRAGVTQLHASAGTDYWDKSGAGNPEVRFSPAALGPEGLWRGTDEHRVRALRAALDDHHEQMLSQRPAAPKKGLVLAGGGAKGSYQVGVWQALTELGWKPDIICGTSVGCLNGALFALDQAELARAMWSKISSRDVMDLPEHVASHDTVQFLHSIVRQGGLDVTPLEEIVERVCDEEALRRGPVAYGLVTVEKRTLHPLELSLDEIPQGQLSAYMLASAACFPAFKPRLIDGVAFIDGGYSDNMPTGLAARMGAGELVTVDVDGVGISRPNRTGLPTVQISSRWDLGSILQFDPATAQRNIVLGYLDTYRAFGRLRGTAYGVRPCSAEQVEALFLAAYERTMAPLRADPVLALAEKTALALFNPGDRDLAVLELAARYAGVNPARAYTVQELVDAFRARYDITRAEAFSPLFAGEPDFATSVALRARAAAQNTPFLAAVLWHALTDSARPAQ